MKNFIFIIVFSVILSVNAYAKKLNWKFEKSSQENELNMIFSKNLKELDYI